MSRITWWYRFNDQVCDVGVGPVVIRYDRYQLSNFIHPWVTEPVRLLIPMPVLVSDSSAFFEPLSSTVNMFLNDKIMNEI